MDGFSYYDIEMKNVCFRFYLEKDEVSNYTGYLAVVDTFRQIP